jgi:hypothetical protein
MRRLIAAAAAAGVLMAVSGGAAQACIDCGKGGTGPVEGAGVTSQGGGTTYLTLTIPQNRTLVEAFGGQTVMRWKTLPGLYGVPTVAAAVPEGLSFDGKLLILERFASTYPKQKSGFAVLRTKSLRVERMIDLRGDFSYDALSPDGRILYLIEHPRPNSPNSYRVRALDVQSGRLFEKPVADPWEGPRMSGYAVARATSADGALVYTLYQQGNRKMFVHALDTMSGTARCIDLPPMAMDSNAMTLSPDGRTLLVSLSGEPMVTVDTATFSARVWNATPEPPKPDPAPAVAESGGHNRLLAGGLAAVVLLAAAGALLAVRRRAASPQAG